MGQVYAVLAETVQHVHQRAGAIIAYKQDARLVIAAGRIDCCRRVAGAQDQEARDIGCLVLDVLKHHWHVVQLCCESTGDGGEALRTIDASFGVLAGDHLDGSRRARSRHDRSVRVLRREPLPALRERLWLAVDLPNVGWLGARAGYQGVANLRTSSSVRKGHMAEKLK